ncbi:MAG: HlyD family efflux transporter periplasmic adaptor subunit [Saccharofermentanaceae bacterium]|nr:HlyD family efflux transporter periplasmic adaptor subunit [Saccharofermentanaceae bacterium]
MSDENKKKKSRKWIVKALIAFLVIMGILTFFSNTIMNMTLTQVSTQQVYGATLSSISRASGTLHANSEVKVKAPGEVTIAEVPVYLYQEVEEGAVLATFETSEDHADLDEARKSLQELEKEMEYDARKPAENSDYYDMEMAVYDAEKAVKQAEKNLAAAKNKDAVVSQTRTDIKAIQDQLTQIEKDKTVLESKKQELESRRDTAYEKIESAKETLTSAQDALASCITDPSDPNFDQAALDQANKDVEDAQKEVQKEQASYNSISDELSSVCSQLVDKEQAYTKKSTELEEKQADLAEFEQITTVEEAERALKDAKHTLQVARKTLSDAKTNAGISSDREKDTKEEKLKQKEDLEKKIKELEDYYKITEIRAPISGMLISINATRGGQCMKGDEMFIIADMNSGMYVDCQVEKKDADTMMVGAEVRTDYCDSAFVDSVRPDPSDPVNSRIVRVSVEGSYLVPGAMQISCTISTSNRYYDCVVPKGAVQTDSEGTFIYILLTKNSPLGERYIARKLPVKILAEDSTSYAIEGAGVNMAYCIVRTEKPIKNGEQVRLAQGETN